MQRRIIGIEHLVTGMATGNTIITSQINQLLNIRSADVDASTKNNRIDGDSVIADNV